MFKVSKALIIASLFVVSTLMLTGCWGPSKAALNDTEKSAEGIALEDYLPKDTLVMVSVSTQDKEQKEAFDKLFSYFPQEDLDKLWENMIEELTLELEETGMTYEEDIAPIFSDNFRFTFGMAGDMTQDDPDMYIALTLADKEKAKSLIEKMLEEDEEGNLSQNAIMGAMTVDNEDKDMYLALYKDTLLITNIKENREAAIKRVIKNEESILSNDLFKNSYKGLPKPNLGIMFINLKELFAKLSQAELDEDEKLSMEFIESLYGEAFALTAKEDGLMMVVQVAFDENNDFFNLKNYPYLEPYMYKNIPGEKLIMYMESYGMKEAFDIQMKALMADEESQKGLRQFKAILKSALDLSLDDDILSWMDKGFAFVMQHNQNIIPAISIYIDASSNPDDAQKVLDLIDAGMQQAVESAFMDAPEDLDVASILKKDTVTLGKSEINRVSFDITGLSEEQLLEAGLPSGVFPEPVEMYYGMTDEDYFLFSTYTGLDKDYEKTTSVAENNFVKESRNYIKDYPYQLTYISVEEVMNYVDTFVGFMQLIEGPMGKDVQEGLDKVKSYLAPIKYMVAGNKKVENIAEGGMFVKMEQPEQAEK